MAPFLEHNTVFLVTTALVPLLNTGVMQSFVHQSLSSTLLYRMDDKLGGSIGFASQVCEGRHDGKGYLVVVLSQYSWVLYIMCSF